MRRQLGFTLLEILLVMTLLTSVASVVVFNLPDSSRDALKRTIGRLTIQIDSVSDNALIHGRTYGLRIEATHYRFFRLEKEEWLPVDVAVALPDGMRFDLDDVEGFAPDTKHSPESPQVWFWTDGTLTPFDLSVNSARGHYQLSVNGLGHSDGAFIGDAP